MTAPAIASLRLNVRARDFALAWLNTFLATSDDDARPLLYQTICVEQFEHGMQLVATSGHILFRTWVPELPDEGMAPAEWPELEEAPERSLIAVDTDGFAKSFMQSVLRLTGVAGGELWPLTIATMTAESPEGELFLGDSLAAESLVFAAFGQRATLRVFEDQYPDWRKAEFGVPKNEYVAEMTVAPKLLALVGKIREASQADMAFSGTTTAIVLDVRGTSPLRGLLMPMRKSED